MPNEKNMTLDMLQTTYEIEVREQARQEIEERYDKSQTPSFFEKFRQVEHTQPVIKDKNNDTLYKKYCAFKEDELRGEEEKIELLRYRIAYERLFLRWERSQSHEKSNGATRYRVDQITQLQNELAHLIKESPEAWQIFYQRQWEQDCLAHESNRLVGVPYVERTKEKVRHALSLGHPVYIVGHLGSGKTQLAIETAIDFSIQTNIQYELETMLERHYQQYPDKTEEDLFALFCHYYTERQAHYEGILAHGTKDEIESLQPLFISGSHHLTYEDMFVEKTLSLEQHVTNESFSEYMNTMIKDYTQWMDAHSEYMTHISKEEQLQLRVQIWQSFSNLLIAKNNTFGTTVKKIERELLTAIKEGRPVIIDELNTIAMQNLIALNDLLQRHAGQTAYITGVGPVYIKPGFALIGTGNLSSQLVSYEGTNQLNPAFESRFITIEYNYVPQNMLGDLVSQEQPEKNELFRVMLSKLAFSNGAIQLPNSKQSLDELFRFAQLCKLTQDVFIGKWVEESEVGSFTQVELRESVLSIRNIMHVLDDWNLGEEKDLSKALWDSFISSITYPEDQTYILGQAIKYGFFKTTDGWSITNKGLGDSLITYDDIREIPYYYQRGSIETLSYLDVCHLLFGLEPKRVNIPKGLEQPFQDTKGTFNQNKYQEKNKQVNKLEYTSYLKNILDEIGEDNDI